jgi:hypothetical protein
MHRDELWLTNCGSKENQDQDYLAASRNPIAILPSIAGRNTCCTVCVARYATFDSCADSSEAHLLVPEKRYRIATNFSLR